jgi:hypothetical protein
MHVSSLLLDRISYQQSFSLQKGLLDWITTAIYSEILSSFHWEIRNWSLSLWRVLRGSKLTHLVSLIHG